MSTAPRDAVEARPWRRGEEPEPRYRFFPYSEAPGLSIRVQGRWHHAAVRAREDRADGRVIYHVEISLTVGGVRGTYRKAYVWNPATMHRPPPVSGALS
ncbi:hypothetical protein ABZ820_33840 [Streptomyces diacarni]|uniref:hypothetical protein n=1 Tax=Streptomyces diacarni TaxID=2800381 RepID=UPI00340E694C